MINENYDEWFTEYHTDIINLYKILLRYGVMEDNNQNFNKFCEFLYKN